MINDDIKNLINSYVDGELSERKQHEVHRLLDHDKKADEYYNSILKVRQLVGGLEHCKIGSGISASVITHIERKMIMDSFDAVSETKTGEQYLYFRKIAAAAAILILVGGLSLVIFQILSPIGNPTKKDIQPAISANRAFNERVLPIKLALTLCAKDMQKSTKLFNGLIYSQMLINNTVPYRHNDISKYTINCSKEQAISLIAAMESDWKQFEFANAVIGLANSDIRQEILAIEPDQLITLLAISDPQAKMAKAARFAKDNNQELKKLPQNNLDILNEPVEPKLTSEQFSKGGKQSIDEYPVNIEIVIQSVK